MSWLAPFPVLVTLATAGLLLGGSRWLGRRVVDLLAIAAAAVALAMCVILIIATRDTPIVYWMGGWRPRGGLALGICFHIDPIAAAMAALASALMTGALVYSARYFEAFEGRYHALMMLFLAALIGFSLSLDLFNLFVWFEVMSVTAFALTGYHHEEAPAIQGGINFAITNSVGSFASLFGIGLIYARTGALDLAQIGAALSGSRGDPLVAVALVLVCIGLLVKAAVVPFHFWLADAHAVAPTPVCILFSGIMVELGIYGIARIYWSGFATAHLGPAFSTVLVISGVVTIAIGSVMCFAQKHLKRMLAFSTIAHTGIVLVGVGLLQPRALAGAIAYIAAHGVTKAALFACAGILLHRFGGVNELHLHGVGRHLRGTAILYMLAVASLAGAPPFGTFHARASIDEALRASGQGWVVHVLTLGTIVTTAAVLRAGLRIFGGLGRVPTAGELGDHADIAGSETLGPRGRVPWQLWASTAAFVVLAVLLGVVPGSVREQLLASAARMTAPQAYLHDVFGAAEPVISAPPLWSAEYETALVCTAGALLLALATTFLGHHVRSEPVSRALRSLHAGDIRDYVTWMFAGIAILLASVVALAV